MGDLLIFAVKISLLFLLVVLVTCVIVLSTVLFMVGAIVGGTFWGGGWAILNYGKSIKENMIDSNRKGA